MSYAYLRLALNTDLDRRERYILIELADCANKDGLAWPGYERLCNKTKYDLSQVKRGLATLTQAGYIEVAQKSKRGKRVRYRLLMTPVNGALCPPIEAPDEGALCPPGDIIGGALCPDEGALCPPAIRNAHAVLREPINEPISEGIYNTDTSSVNAREGHLEPAVVTPPEPTPEPEPDLVATDELSLPEPPVATRQQPPLSPAQTSTDRPQPSAPAQTGTHVHQQHRQLLADITARVAELSGNPCEPCEIVFTVENLIRTCVRERGEDFVRAYIDWIGCPVSGLPFWKNATQHGDNWQKVIEPASLFKPEYVSKRAREVKTWMANNRPRYPPGVFNLGDDDSDRDEWLYTDMAGAPFIDGECTPYPGDDPHADDRQKGVPGRIQGVRGLLPAGAQYDARGD